MGDVQFGELENDPCLSQSKEPVQSKVARCGNPNQDMNDDEKAIREVIDQSPGKFHAVDAAVEEIRLRYLLNFPTDKDTIGFNRVKAFRTLQEAMDGMIQTKFGKENGLVPFDEFLA